MISEEDQGRQLRELYVRLTTSKSVFPSYVSWEELPQLTRDAWIAVYQAVYENHPDKERMDWLEGESRREEKADHAGLPFRSIYRLHKPVTRQLVDSYMAWDWCEDCCLYHHPENPTCKKQEKMNDTNDDNRAA